MKLTDFALNVLASIAGGIIWHFFTYGHHTIKRLLELADAITRQLCLAVSSFADRCALVGYSSSFRSPQRVIFALFLILGVTLAPMIRPVRTDQDIVPRNPFAGRGFEYREGDDFEDVLGSPLVQSPASGKVTITGWKKGYGRFVSIDHGGGFSTTYGHLARVNVKVGQSVNKGDLIGFVGARGRSSGPHLHYEVRINAQPNEERQDEKSPLPFMNRLLQRPNDNSVLIASSQSESSLANGLRPTTLSSTFTASSGGDW